MNSEALEIPHGNKPKIKVPYALVRVLISLFLGLVAFIAIILYGHPNYALLVGWNTVSITWILWTVLLLRDPDAQKTESIAKREDPGRKAVDILLVLSSLGSLVAVAILIAKVSQSQGTNQLALTLLGLLTIISSWLLVHLIYTIHYAVLYYKNGGGISFNSHQSPNFIDFLYLSITVATSFQVSDTPISRREIRKIISHHVIISYIYGTVIIATAVNILLNIR